MKRGPLSAVFMVVVSGFLFSQSLARVDVVTEEWEGCTEADGTGLYFDILRAVFEPEGSKLNIQLMPYTRAVEAVSAKKADLVPGPYADEVEGVLYPKWNLDFDNVSALYMKAKFPSFTGSSALAGKSVAWMRGYGYEEYFTEKMNVIEVDKRENAINLLLKNRIDVFLDAQSDIEAALEAAKTDTSKVSITPMKYMKLFVCFADTPKGKKLAEIWDRNFKKALDSGKIKALFQKWDMADSYRF